MDEEVADVKEKYATVLREMEVMTARLADEIRDFQTNYHYFSGVAIKKDLSGEIYIPLIRFSSLSGSRWALAKRRRYLILDDRSTVCRPRTENPTEAIICQFVGGSLWPFRDNISESLVGNLNTPVKSSITPLMWAHEINADLQAKNADLEDKILELELRPPDRGGELYERARRHFEKAG